MTAHQLQAAKQQFSAVADKAARGIPQLVTKHGKPFVVIVGADDWNRSRPTGGGIWDALRACPVDLGGLNITRNKDLSRHVAL